MLQELVANNYRGWALYMDADAWIADLSFDLRNYLRGMERYSIIGASAFDLSDQYWNYNIGVLLLNFSYPFTASLLADWQEVLSRYNLEEDALEWGGDIPDDQAMFHEVLQGHDDAKSHVLHVSKDFINSPDACFVKQAIRAESEDIEKRVQYIKAEVAVALAKHGEIGPG
jgi:hypothetical protein